MSILLLITAGWSRQHRPLYCTYLLSKMKMTSSATEFSSLLFRRCDARMPDVNVLHLASVLFFKSRCPPARLCDGRSKMKSQEKISETDSTMSQRWHKIHTTLLWYVMDGRSASEQFHRCRANLLHSTCLRKSKSPEPSNTLLQKCALCQS